MVKRVAILTAVVTISLTIFALAFNKNYRYVNLLLIGAHRYPTGEPIEHQVIFRIDPQTILSALSHGQADVFLPAPVNPIYNNVPPLQAPPSHSWKQQDFLRVADSVHQYVWNEPLKEYHLYSMSFTLPRCTDLARFDDAGFAFYQRQGDWYYLVHDIGIDLQFGYVYAGDNNGYYTGSWKDIDLSKAVIQTAEQALSVAEQNGGRDSRLAASEEHECFITINLPQNLYEHKSWTWQVTYWINSGASSIYEAVIDPLTGRVQVLTGR